MLYTLKRYALGYLLVAFIYLSLAWYSLFGWP